MMFLTNIFFADNTKNAAHGSDSTLSAQKVRNHL